MKDPPWYRRSTSTRTRKIADPRDVGSSVPRSKSQTEFRKHTCETDVGSPKLKIRSGIKTIDQ